MAVRLDYDTQRALIAKIAENPQYVEDLLFYFEELLFWVELVATRGGQHLDPELYESKAEEAQRFLERVLGGEEA